MGVRMLAAMSSTPASSTGQGEVVLRGRADACPGTLRLHSADDGGLARVRLAGGVLSAAQADVLAMVADHLSDGHLDLTSRGNVQLRGLAANAGRELAVWLESSDLLPSRLHERARNYVASPLAGLDGRGRGPVRGLLEKLDRALCESERATELSGRFLFALDDGRGDVAALAPDVTLLAQGEGEVLLRIGAGGVHSAGALRVHADDAPRAALHAAELFLTAAQQFVTDQLPDPQSATRVWRVRDLPPSYVPTPTALANALAAQGVNARPAPYPELPAVSPPPPGEIQGPDGVRSLVVLAPLGRLTSSALRALAKVALTYGRSELRLTPWRGVVLPGVGWADAAQTLANEGLAVDANSPWRGVGACVGRPGCAKALADVRGDAARTLPAPAPGRPAGRDARAGHEAPTGREAPTGQAPGREALPVYWSGCERRCGHPVGSWIDVLADGAGYQISVRGQPGAPAPVRHVVNPGELAASLAEIREAAPPRGAHQPPTAAAADTE